MNHSQQLEQSLEKRTELICTPNIWYYLLFFGCWTRIQGTHFKMVYTIWRHTEYNNNKRKYNNKKSRIGEISRKLSISERNVSYKSCRVLNDLFTDLVNLILGGVAKIRSRSHRFFLNDIQFFIPESNNRCRELSKTLIKLFFIEYFSSYKTRKLQYRWD